MELIDVSGYISEEKIEIARKHLVPKQLSEHGFAPKEIDFRKQRLQNNQRLHPRIRSASIGQEDCKILRRIARLKASNKEFSPTISISSLKELLGPEEFISDIYEGNEFVGVVTGLAWTAVGGEILYIESSLSKGKGENSPSQAIWATS